MSDIDAKKQRFATFLVERLTSPEAKREVRANLEAMYAELEGRTLADVLPREALRAGLELAKRPDVYTKLVSRIGTAVHTEAYPRVLSHEATLGSYVPAAARAKIDELLARPNLVNPKRYRFNFDHLILLEWDLLIAVPLATVFTQLEQGINYATFFGDYAVLQEIQWHWLVSEAWECEQVLKNAAETTGRQVDLTKLHYGIMAAATFSRLFYRRIVPFRLPL